MQRTIVRRKDSNITSVIITIIMLCFSKRCSDGLDESACAAVSCIQWDTAKREPESVPNPYQERGK